MATDAIYQPLNKDYKEIRILHVHGSTNFADILECTLETVSLLANPKPQYETISYCWGQAGGCDTIHLNGTVVEAPRSAVQVLRTFRTKSGNPRCIWLDALCINQADITERSSQVSIMGEVYSSCTNCLIWLGDADEKTETLLRALEFVSDAHYGRSQELDATILRSDIFDDEKGYKVLSALPTECSLKDIYAFFGRPWFTRLWVMQEAVLAPRSTCYCGQSKLEWHIMQQAAYWAHSMARILVGPAFPSRTRAAVAGIRMIITSIHIRQRYKFRSDRTEVIFLPALRGYLSATDERDNFYGLLGLVQRDPEKEGLMQWFQVDYNLPSNVVAGDAVRFYIIQSANLNILEDTDGLHFPTDFSKTTDLPSWVLPLTSSSQFTKFRGEHHCARRPVDLALIRNSVSDKCLLLKGFGIFQISEVMCSRDFAKEMPWVEQIQNLGLMVNEFVQRFCRDNDNEIGSIKSMLQIITLQTQDLRLDSLSNEDCTAWAMSFVQHCKRRGAQTKSAGERPPFESSELDLTEYNEDYIRFICANRRFFLTKCGRIGLGPARIEKGDWVVALFGCKSPCILRSCIKLGENGPNIDLENERRRCQFVGIAYIPGVMNGEAVEEKEAAGQEPEIFEIW